ncbi:hypothetical protein SUGI_0638750 [Cryptomeria japonica]|uniref:uncharacterized protein LOC131052797 n=1 Tax=Cryptomeria japonica TaxID=3369 RepID=UPI0024147FAE|nr:uncharacterized protein LOC131052797 [Cryptomeria japonica]GLJ31755.1 hypothetical protein SUGI_0638750 [Cryptomeria japonica]
MGNCMQPKVRRETCKKFIKVMAMDGKMLEYRSPVVGGDLVRESDFEEDCMVVHSRNDGHALPQENTLKGGELYYLVPSLMEAHHRAFSAQKNGICRGKKRAGDVEKSFTLKIVVSRQQLKSLLLDSCVKEILVEQHARKLTQQQDCVSGKAWRPCLDTIAEEY